MSKGDFDNAQKMFDAIIAVDPESQIAKSVVAFQPQFAEMRKQAEAQQAPEPPKKEEAKTETSEMKSE